MPHNRMRVQRLATLTALLLLLPSAAVVALTTDRPLGTGSFMVAILAADVILCLFLGFGCMLLAYCIAILKGEWHRPQPLLGFGAALLLIVFTVGAVLGRLVHPGSTSEPPSNPGQTP